MMMTGCCRFCGANLHHTFVDLGMSPLANAYLTPAQLNQMEPFFPLHVYVCERCFLVQLEEFASPEDIFSEYAYFASYSETWLHHARTFVDMALERFDLHANHQVVEIASNDGYLLQYFVTKGIPVLGIEPAANVAEIAIQKGIPTRVAFFGEDMAHRMVTEGLQADLVVGNNVLAHVPQLNDFVRGLKLLLKPRGVITLERGEVDAGDGPQQPRGLPFLFDGAPRGKGGGATLDRAAVDAQRQHRVEIERRTRVPVRARRLPCGVRRRSRRLAGRRGRASYGHEAMSNVECSMSNVQVER